VAEATLRHEDERHSQIKAVIPVVYCPDLADNGLLERLGARSPSKPSPAGLESVHEGFYPPSPSLDSDEHSGVGEG